MYGHDIYMLKAELRKLRDEFEDFKQIVIERVLDLQEGQPTFRRKLAHKDWCKTEWDTDMPPCTCGAEDGKYKKCPYPTHG